MRFRLVVMIALIGFLATGCDDPEATDEETTEEEEESTEESEEPEEAAAEEEEEEAEPELVDLGFWELKGAVPEGFEMEGLPFDDEGVEVFGDVGAVQVQPWIESQDSDLDSVTSWVEEENGGEILASEELENGWILQYKEDQQFVVQRYAEIEAGEYECTISTAKEEGAEFAYEFCLSVTE